MLASSIIELDWKTNSCVTHSCVCILMQNNVILDWRLLSAMECEVSEMQCQHSKQDCWIQISNVER